MDKNPNTTFMDYLNSMGDGKRDRDKNAPDFGPVSQPPDNHQIEKVHKVQNDISSPGKVSKLKTFL